jgi:hypothetical protein
MLAAHRRTLFVGFDENWTSRKLIGFAIFFEPGQGSPPGT